MKITSKTFQATSMRSALIFLTIISIVVSVVGFYFAQDWLTNISNDINKSAVNANPNDNSPQELANLRTEISKNKSAADKAKSALSTIVGYKDQMTKDIKTYAANANITIKKIDTSQQTQPSGLSNNIQIGYATVTISNPVSARNLILFFKGIESNLPKMQIKGIDISGYQNSTGSINLKTITIEEYIR